MPLVLESPREAKKAPHTPKASGCQHCGTPLASGQAQFCCAGCEYVHGLIGQAGWGRYYALKPTVIPPVAPSILQPVDFSWLRNLQAEAEARAVAGSPELSVQIQGLYCVACVWLVDQIFVRQPGAVRIEVDAPRGRARLIWESGVADLSLLATELHRFGYQLGPVDAQLPLPASRALTGRLGVCAALALNNMLFTLPGYLGLASNSEWTGLFRAITAVCATLSLIVGGGYFMGRAWRGLRIGVLDLDLPIALGVTGAYLGSLAGWLLGHPELVYFDFVSLFLFLMLVGRWTQEAAIERNRHSLLTLNPVPATVRRASSLGEPIALESLQVGDHFLIGPGELLPVASRVLDDATLGLAWITGEPEPRRLPAGRLAPAGAINAGQADLKFTAQERWEHSLLARLLQACTDGRPRATGLERTLKIYLETALLLAFSGGIFWLWADQPITAARVTLSLLVVSCPCVLGLALPMAHEFAVARLRRAGVFVRETHLWSRLARVRTIVFDKTGTLTLEHPVLQNKRVLSTQSPGARRILFHLVENSLHPFSRGLREALLSYPDLLAPDFGELVILETPGLGLRVEIGATTWSLGRPGWRPGGPELVESHPTEPDRAAPRVEFRCNGRFLAGFDFAESLRPGAKAEVAALQAAGYDLHILSGDRSENVLALAEKLGLPLKQAHGGMSPDDKAAWVKAHHPERVLMLGDGANDALAFQSAAVRGTPVADRVVLSQVADFFLTGQSLDGVRHLLVVGRIRQRAARAAITFALIYNCSVAVVCLLGKMNPLLAAILMPSSSLLSLALVSTFFRKDSSQNRNSTYAA